MSFLQTRRGAERFLFVLTVVVAVVFVGASLAVIVR
jgi:preprotein translocase subunit SecG